MASIQEMKAQLTKVAQDIDSNAQKAEVLKAPLVQARSQVKSLFQGSSKGVDASVMQAISSAEDSVTAARKALAMASQTLNDYARQL